VEFVTGYGLESVLPDATCKRIEREYITPRFKEKNYDQGLSDGLSAIIKMLTSPKKISSSDIPDSIKSKEKDPSALGRAIAWIIAIPYLLLMTVLFFVKKTKGAFTEGYNKLSEAKKRNITLTMSVWKWLWVYFFIPLVFYSGMIIFYNGPYFIVVLLAGVYLMILLALLDKKNRSKKAYAASYKAGDYYDQYNKFSKYFDNWGIAAVFFPVPFLFTDLRNAEKLKAIRKHERPCSNCHAAMILLDEKKEEELSLKREIFEESIKSVDYDVWYCPSCRSHHALGYNSKFSKYKPCSFCGTKASFLQLDVTKVTATYNSDGIGEKTYKCMYCKKISTEEYSISTLTRSSGNRESNSDVGSALSPGSSR
ncbi:MAG TPA: TPM domain-containing protein, partial [Cytophagaceae bacterium]|nr:TPM domain-containing protein [Cytophagaceae bacterium]